MRSRFSTWIASAALGAIALMLPSNAPAGEHAFHHENVMGTSLEIRVRADSPAAAKRAEGRILAEIDRLSAISSSYDPASEFRRWQDHPQGPAPISPELYQLLDAADSWRLRTSGAFDPRVQVLTQLWAEAARTNRLPTDAQVDAAKARLAAPAWRLDPARRTAERLGDGPLTLNAIAKGFILEAAARAGLNPEDGAPGVALNGGGDYRAIGTIARTVGIAPPTEESENAEPIVYVELKDRALATSGSSQRGFAINGAWYSHIFDPRTGRPAGHVSGASVIAKDSADADALATILNVVPIEDGLRLIASVKGAEALIIGSDGRMHRSAGWANFERARPVLAASGSAVTPSAVVEPVADEPTLGKGMELRINLEIANPGQDNRRYRRPYVAVWIEDREGSAVRTLALWVQSTGPGPRWIPDLKTWYRSDQARRLVDETNLVTTVARPTRAPGKYSLVWDGKDDAGQLVEPGEYVLHIEAAREHGTYQVVPAKTLKLGSTPIAAEGLKGNVEIKSASVEYRRARASR